MTRPFSLAFKQKMVDRLTGKDALNPSQLAREMGLRQQSLSRWLQDARSLPRVGADKRIECKWTVEIHPDNIGHRVLGFAAVSVDSLLRDLHGDPRFRVLFAKMRLNDCDWGMIALA
jgi:hypothetical protein